MSFRKPFLIALTLLTGGIVSSQGSYSAGDVVENFTLTKYGTEQEVELHDLEGKVIFLEWFAWWCPYCQAAAAKTETDIVDYYDDRDGNTNGIPVKHVALNLVSGQETQTQNFIDSYGLGLVLDDPDRDVADLFQSSGQPIFAIINGVEDSASHKQWELLYSLRGYGSTNPPISTFRRHIDSVEAEAAENGDPVVTITGGNAITEGGNASFTLTATPAPSASLDVSVNVADDSDSDFVASGNEGARTVTIPTSGTVSFTVATENDEVDEANGSVSATVNSGSGYTVGTTSSASVTVNDNDEPPPVTPVVTITGGSAITEGGNARFTLTATPAPPDSLDVGVNVADDADSDFVASGNEGARTVTIPTSGTISFTVATENDEVDEANGSVSATVNSGIGYTVGTTSSATVTVNDDDEPPPPPPTPVVTITGGNAITEGGNARFTLTATPAPPDSLNVAVDVADDADSDFVASGNEGARTVTIPTGGTVSFTVATENDEVDEANGSVSATVNSGSGYTVGTTSSASVTVNDDDKPPPMLPSEYMNYLSNQGIPESHLQQDLDPDSDGVPNVFEYYFGSDASDTASFSQTTPIIVMISSTPYNALQFVRNPNAVGVTISVEFSDSPSFDSLIGSVPFSNQPLENGLEEVVVRSGLPLSGREFSRLIYRSEDL